MHQSVFSEIISCYSDKIRIEHDKEHFSTAGWIDFNETCLGITNEREDSEIYTEIQYSSLDDWYISEGKTSSCSRVLESICLDSCFCLDMKRHNIAIKIVLDGPVKFKITSLLQAKSVKQVFNYEKRTSRFNSLYS